MLFIGVLLIVNWSQCPHCSRFPQSNLLNKNLKIIIKKFIEAILENYKKMHFFLIYDENFHLLRSGDKKSSTE